MDGRYIALRVAIINQTARTIVARWTGVSGKWITSAHGESHLVFNDRTRLTFSRVGGVVSETSFKFFIQFVFYTMVFCLFCLIVCAYFVAELKREVRFSPACGLCIY